MTLTIPKKITSSFASAPVEALTAIATGWTDYWSGALDRGIGPLEVVEDAATWWRTITTHREPRWASQAPVVRTWPVARLLDYSAEEPAVQVATLVLPPQAGHASSIVDFAPGQSQMDTIRAAGLDRLYTLDWLSATDATKHYTIEDYLDVVHDAIDEIGGPVNLVGDCQGGWMGTIYAALYPEHINSLTIGGAPIDTHAGDPVILEWIKLMGGDRDTTAYHAIVDANGGLYSGVNQVNGFKLMQPAGEIERIWGLLPQVHDPEAVRRYEDFTDWFEWTQDIAGPFYLWIVEELFIGNKLISGEMRIGDRQVDLSRIDCQVNLLAGTEDHITPPDQVWALADYVSTPKKQISRELVDAGHLGLFMGRRSLEEHWSTLMANVLSVSNGAKPARRSPAKPVKAATRAS